MVTKLDGHIMRCVRDQNGNHVTQKCIFIHFQLTQLENGNYARLSKEVIERSHQLRNMRGEELQGLNIEELQQLEKLIYIVHLIYLISLRILSCDFGQSP
ncbi:hypothetical protein AQUCO_06400036v1 [Aquilegia coerulea]|uniref:K-box domain-containing protein n=1 Tax=Aquilegia coerulea TaxID=218851 RepID=A0A2G5CCJ2_AQUCA|nr:hypothetical protein AQUCO_06400036v1 [Aquilegia coerulea]PIA28984.1 hypothetical protein AQUCO_06400036v1 [Aquilegia coerulea]PIA28985.1 hypothetical protein AQUCO_06400036v1 [Aquilegia coerulea]